SPYRPSHRSMGAPPSRDRLDKCSRTPPSAVALCHPGKRMAPPGRRLPIGAEVLPDGGVHFRVWAPRRKSVEVALEGRRRADNVPSEFVRLEAEPDGYFSGTVAEARPGTLYRYRLDGGERYPDPASRFQPEGPHGPSQVVDA